MYTATHWSVYGGKTKGSRWTREKNEMEQCPSTDRARGGQQRGVKKRLAGSRPGGAAGRGAERAVLRCRPLQKEAEGCWHLHKHRKDTQCITKASLGLHWDWGGKVLGRETRKEVEPDLSMEHLPAPSTGDFTA